MSDNLPIVVVEDASLVGRIHAMLFDLHRHGRMSCAEVALIHALTQNPDLPDGFRKAYCGPFMRDPVSGGGDLMPVVNVSAIEAATEKARELKRRAALVSEACSSARPPTTQQP